MNNSHSITTFLFLNKIFFCIFPNSKPKNQFLYQQCVDLLDYLIIEMQLNLMYIINQLN